MDEIQVPLDWKKIKLGEIVKFKSGNSKPKDTVDQPNEEKKIPVYGGNGILGYTNSLFSNQRLLVIGRVGAYCGCIHIAESPNWITDNALYSEKWVINDIYIDFLAEYLKFFNLNRFQRKGGQPLITQSIIHNLYLYLPPLPEQKTIAHTLRTIQKAKETRQRELELERERKAALMQYLFTHGTCNEPRKQTNIGKIPETWEVVTVDKVCEFLQYGTSKLCDSDTSGIPVLRIPNVIGGKINIFDLKFTKPEKKEFEKLSLEAGDLLFVRTNGRKEYIGRCAVFCGKPPRAMFASYLIRVRLKVNILLPEFFQFYTMTHRGKSYLSGRASNAADGKFNINTQTIKAVLVPIPPIDEQHEIIGTLQACDRKIQALEKELTLIDELFHAMLEQLMTGQISTQPVTETYV
ncbi:restriction endonuclease subunit S [Nostoc sp.]